MTYNVLNRNTKIDELGDIVLSQSPDLIGFQELIPANSSSIQHLLTGNGFPNHTPLPKEHRLDVGAFTRFPIKESNQLNLPWLDLSWHTIIEIEGTPVHFFVLHLIPTLVGEVPIKEWPSRIREREEIRMDQITRVLEALPTEDEPVILVCDCNFTETTFAYARIDSVLDDSFQEEGWGFGHTVHPAGVEIAFSRVDYIWHSPHFVTKKAFVISDGPSDHYAVVADLMFIEDDG
jgi:endonuclease/exonuclease/phosphatase (EEP) superfamily protein YafD